MTVGAIPDCVILAGLRPDLFYGKGFKAKRTVAGLPLCSLRGIEIPLALLTRCINGLLSFTGIETLCVVKLFVGVNYYAHHEKHYTKYWR
jgi:hypothetical protein